MRGGRWRVKRVVKTISRGAERVEQLWECIYARSPARRTVVRALYLCHTCAPMAGPVHSLTTHLEIFDETATCTVSIDEATLGATRMTSSG